MASSSILFSLVSSLVILTIFLNPFTNFFNLIGFDPILIPILVTIVIGNGVQNILRTVLISKLKSKSIVLPSIISSFSRFPIFFIMFFSYDNELLNVGYSYSIFFICFSFLLFLITIKILKKISGYYFKNFRNDIKLALKGSLPRWIPGILDTVGQRLSIVTIFSISGAAESGLAFIAFAIFSFVQMIPGSINLVNHTVYSGSKDLEFQEKLFLRSLKTAFLISLPIIAVLYFYGGYLLSIFGSQYIVSNEILSVLLVAFPAAIIGEAIYVLIHSRGQYKNVLIMGLFGNIPRIILYFVLVPILGGIGGAIAFTIGFVTQAIFAAIFAKKMEIHLQYKQYLMISLIPFIIGLFLSFYDFGLIGIPIIIIVSILIFLRIKILEGIDIENILGILFSSEKSKVLTDDIIVKLKKFKLI